jgi:hypothetical protein
MPGMVRVYPGWWTQIERLEADLYAQAAAAYHDVFANYAQPPLGSDLTANNKAQRRADQDTGRTVFALLKVGKSSCGGKGVSRNADLPAEVFG